MLFYLLLLILNIKTLFCYIFLKFVDLLTVNIVVNYV